MKKLMLIAALAAVVGAQGACKDKEDASSDAAVYVWQFRGRTSTAVKVTETTGGGCVDTGSTGCAIRVPGSLAIQAYTYICDYYCETFETLLKDSKTQYSATAPWKSKVYEMEDVFQIDVAHVVGKAPTQYELAGQANFAFTNASDLNEVFWFYFAGFGTFQKATGLVTAVNGQFAGLQSPPRYNGIIKLSESNKLACPPADYWDCQTLQLAGDPLADSVAYGNWSVRYNAAYSKKLATNSKFRVLKTSK